MLKKRFPDAIQLQKPSTAAAKFSHLTSKVDITSFSDTLNSEIPEQREALIKRLLPFNIISTMRERTSFPADVIDELPNLKLLLTTGMKNAAIDMAACRNRGIVVVGAKGAGRARLSSPPTSLDSTLEHTWALILGLARHVARDDVEVKHGGWETSYATGLKGKILAVLGFGKLGSDVARVGLLAFGMNILAWSPSLTQEIADRKAHDLGLPGGAFRVAESKEDLLKAADVLKIHYVLSKRSQGILGAEELSLLKPTSLLVNTSRGPLVDERSVLTVLKKGKIRGAAIDVYDLEPLPLDTEWRTTPWGQNGSSEVLLTPHMGYVEEGVMHRWYDDIVDHVEAWLEGRELETKLN